jgi:hypothetical protein
MNTLYMFRALFPLHQEALQTQQMVYCVRIMSAVVCAMPPDAEQIVFSHTEVVNS